MANATLRYQDVQDFRIYRMRDLQIMLLIWRWLIVWIRISRISGFTGWGIRRLIWAIAVVHCLNQDFQDFRIYRMRYSVVNW